MGFGNNQIGRVINIRASKNGVPVAFVETYCKYKRGATRFQRKDFWGWVFFQGNAKQKAASLQPNMKIRFLNTMCNTSYNAKYICDFICFDFDIITDSKLGRQSDLIYAGNDIETDEEDWSEVSPLIEDD